MFEEYIIKRKNPFVQHNGIQLISCDMNHAETHCDVTEDSMNPIGIVHGGLYFTMMDATAGALVCFDNRLYVTLDSNIHFYKSCTGGRMICTADVIRRGKTICTLSAKVCGEDGTVYADGTLTMFCTSAVGDTFHDKVAKDFKVAHETED